MKLSNLRRIAEGGIGGVTVMRTEWAGACDEAELSDVDRAFLWGRQFLNPFALEGWLEE